MGPSPSTGDVVAADTTVHGLANVSVADAAIMPIVPRANTNFTCFVIGARAADLIARSSPP
jgi:choline dehydrogenase